MIKKVDQECQRIYQWITSLVHLHFLVQELLILSKAAPSGSELIADAKVLRIGKTLAFCEMEVRMKDTNALVAKATHTKFMPVSSKSKAVPAKL